MEKDLLISILKNLSESEYELINAAYFTPNCTLYKYCKENNLNYPKKRRELIALLPKLRKLIESWSYLIFETLLITCLKYSVIFFTNILL